MGGYVDPGIMEPKLERCAVCGYPKHPQDNVRDWQDENGRHHLVHYQCRNGPTAEQRIAALSERVVALERDLMGVVDSVANTNYRVQKLEPLPANTPAPEDVERLRLAMEEIFLQLPPHFWEEDPVIDTAGRTIRRILGMESGE